MYNKTYSIRGRSKKGGTARYTNIAQDMTHGAFSKSCIVNLACTVFHLHLDPGVSLYP